MPIKSLALCKILKLFNRKTKLPTVTLKVMLQIFYKQNESHNALLFHIPIVCFNNESTLFIKPKMKINKYMKPESRIENLKIICIK